MIRFPNAELLAQRARTLRVPLPVIVRDLARIVEILSLREQGFCEERSVLAACWPTRRRDRPEILA